MEENTTETKDTTTSDVTEKNDTVQATDVAEKNDTVQSTDAAEKNDTVQSTDAAEKNDITKTDDTTQLAESSDITAENDITETVDNTSQFSMPIDPVSVASTNDAPSKEPAFATETTIETTTAPVTEEINPNSYTADYVVEENTGHYSEVAVYSTPTNTTSTTVSNTAKEAGFSKGFGIASLILGILSIICCCIGFLGGIIGIVLGCAQKPDPATGKKPGIAIAGIVCSSIGTIIWLIIIVIGLLGKFAVGLIGASIFSGLFN